MKLISSYLKESLEDLPRSSELVDKIITLLTRVSLTKEILDASKVEGQYNRFSFSRLARNYWK